MYADHVSQVLAKIILIMSEPSLSLGRTSLYQHVARFRIPQLAYMLILSLIGVMFSANIMSTLR